jgi:hypothetical protein
MLGKARFEVTESAAGAGYQVKLTLPDSSVVVSGVSREELLGLAEALRKVADGENPLERWDGQSGG